MHLRIICALLFMKIRVKLDKREKGLAHEVFNLISPDFTPVSIHT